MDAQLTPLAMDQQSLNAPQQLRDYSQGWYDMMTQIWRDRLDLLGKYDTGRLRSSVSGAGLTLNDTDLTATFQFVEYGLYVDAGTGRGYTRGNGGDLEFLGREYRKQHGLGKPREPAPWFRKSWYISQRVLVEEMQRIIGEGFAETVSELSLPVRL